MTMLKALHQKYVIDRLEVSNKKVEEDSPALWYAYIVSKNTLKKQRKTSYCSL